MDWRSLMLLALFAWAWEARAAAPDPVASVTVSYTHLDVYKRQIMQARPGTI